MITQGKTTVELWSMAECVNWSRNTKYDNQWRRRPTSSSQDIMMMMTMMRNKRERTRLSVEFLCQECERQKKKRREKTSEICKSEMTVFFVVSFLFACRPRMEIARPKIRVNNLLMSSKIDINCIKCHWEMWIRFFYFSLFPFLIWMWLCESEQTLSETKYL